jgi:hypothetical protein
MDMKSVRLLLQAVMVHVAQMMVAFLFSLFSSAWPQSWHDSFFCSVQNQPELNAVTLNMEAVNFPEILEPIYCPN